MFSYPLESPFKKLYIHQTSRIEPHQTKYQIVCFLEIISETRSEKMSMIPAINEPSAKEDPAFMHPKIDWRETSDAHIFKVDVPGLTREEVKVELEDGKILRISGERTPEKVGKHDKWHRVERSVGKFFRRFRLPEHAKTDQVKATLADGVLTVVIPKVKKERKVKTIPVSG